MDGWLCKVFNFSLRVPISLPKRSSLALALSEERFFHCLLSIIFSQKPITWSFHLPYWPFEPTLSRISLFLEAHPTAVFAGVFVLANHTRAVVSTVLRLHCVTCRPHEIISIMAESAERLKNPRKYLSSKNKKIRDRVDSRVQLRWKLRVMDTCYRSAAWYK